MSGSAHRIRHQRWLVKAPDQAAAFAWRRELRARLDSEIIPAFERAFDALGLGETVLRIPRLSLDVRARNADEALRELPQLIAQQLAQARQAAGLNIPPLPSAQAAARHEDWRQALLHYLASGQLPWHMAGGETPVALHVLREQAASLADTAPHWPLPDSGQPRRRLAWLLRLLPLLPESRLVTWCASCLTQGGDAPEIALAAWLLEQPGLPQGARLALRAVLLSRAHADRGSGLHDAELKAALSEALALPALKQALAQAALPMTAQLAALEPAPAAEAGEQPRAVAATPVAPAVGQPRREEAVVVQDAGLVLLHPFLPRFFEACGIRCGSGKAIPAHLLPRAAALLHWLASGREDAYEFELGVLKPMLGLVPDDALALGGGLLLADDLREGEALLAAVIGHWRSLGKITSEGMRVSFLQRRGLLREVEHGWQLQVEPESFDMLLGKLPWSIAMVRLPWMTRTIFTDWPTP